MKFNNKNKCVEITRIEYEDIEFIINISSCIKDAVINTAEYLKDDNYDKAFNLVMAVKNNYKYMKITA